jgi:hypothetical protein
MKDGLLGLIERSSINFVLSSSRYPEVNENEIIAVFSA